MKFKKIGIIGTGNMGSALIFGIVKGTPPANIKAYDTDQDKLDQVVKETGIAAAKDIEEIISSSDIIILAVKPDKIVNVATMLKKFSGIIVSLAAGINIDTLKKYSGDKKLIRAMPNTPAISGCGMTVISHSESVSSDDAMEVKSLLEYTGKVLIMDEKHMNAVTAISGSGPAYVFTIIQALADAGVKLGLTRNDALQLAGQTLYGSAKMFLDKMENPIKLRDNVTSPAGTTIAALHKFERAGFNGIIIDAVEAAFNRAREIEKTT